MSSDAKEAGKHNVAFLGMFLLGKMQECVELLVEAKRCVVLYLLHAQCV